MKRSRLVRWLVAVTIVAAALAVMLNRGTLSLAGRWLDVGSPPRKADLVVLLNGGYETRPFVAAALVRGGWASKVVYCTVAPHEAQASGAVPSSSAIVRKILEYGEVPQGSIEPPLDVAAKTTFDEARAVADYLVKNPARRLLIVTEGPHTRRARWIFRQVIGDRAEIAMISAPTDEFDTETWWQSEPGFLFVASEYFKLLYYHLRYGHLGWELLIALLAIAVAFAWFRRRRKRTA